MPAHFMTTNMMPDHMPIQFLLSKAITRRKRRSHGTSSQEKGKRRKVHLSQSHHSQPRVTMILGKYVCCSLSTYVVQCNAISEILPSLRENPYLSLFLLSCRLASMKVKVIRNSSRGYLPCEILWTYTLSTNDTTSQTSLMYRIIVEIFVLIFVINALSVFEK